MRFYQLPVDRFSKERLEMEIDWVSVEVEEFTVLPVANARHGFDPKEIGHAEDRRALSMRGSL